MQEFESGLIFSRRERIGIFTLAFLIILITLLIRFLPQQDAEAADYENDRYLQQMDSLFLEDKKVSSPYPARQQKQKYTTRSVPKNKIKYSPDNSFIRDSISILNPNEASVDQLVKIGIPKKVAITLDRFRAKGGRLYKSKDILKIYGLSTSTYETIKDQLQIPTQKREWQKYDTNSPKKEEEEKIVVEINRASKEQLMAIRGIGPYYADRIIRQREELGGYYKLEQIVEIEKLTDSIFQQLKSSLTLTPIIEKKNLNELTLNQIRYHPFFTKQQAREILTHRDFNLKLRSWQEFQNLLKITPKEVERIQAYFDIQ